MAALACCPRLRALRLGELQCRLDGPMLQELSCLKEVRVYVRVCCVCTRVRARCVHVMR